jgi:hypothetical protein
VVGGSLALSAMNGKLLAGLVATPGVAGQLGEADLDTVSLTNAADQPPVTCPAPWTCADIGPPTAVDPGSQLYQDGTGTWTVVASGSDIWDTGDEFHFISQTLAGDGSVSARVASQTNSGAWAKAGVMLRGSASQSAPYYAIYVTPENGVVVQYRTSDGTAAQQAAALDGAVPVYLRVGRVGTVYTAYTSSDGVTWTAVPNSQVDLGLGGNMLAGLAVTSDDTYHNSTVTFDSVAVTNGQ